MTDHITDYNVGGLISELVELAKKDIEALDPDYADEETIEWYEQFKQRVETLDAWLEENQHLYEVYTDNA